MLITLRTIGCKANPKLLSIPKESGMEKEHGACLLILAYKRIKPARTFIEDDFRY